MGSLTNRKKWLIMAVVLVCLIIPRELITYAAPETMPDGTIFDAEYYAANNPDVVAAVGNDPAVLYQHYQLCGKAEGRLPYAAAAVATGNDANVAIQIPVMYGTGWYDLRTLLNSQPLVPTSTGFAYCDMLVDQILSEITTPQMDTYDKVKACYDYLINISCYAGYGEPAPYQNAAAIYELTQNSRRPANWEMYGPWIAEMILESRTGVCDNYACAFAAMTRRIGLNCYCVAGATKSSRGGYSGHTWCEMILSGAVYYFDPEVEDVVANGNKAGTPGNGRIKYYYFGKLYTEKPDRYIRGGYNYAAFLPYTSLTKPNSAVGYPGEIWTTMKGIQTDPNLSDEDRLYVRGQMAQITYQQKGQ